jgi:putative aldouronate transport system permease protein
MAFFVVTMFFSGGIIPRYLLVRNLGMLNTIWAMIIPSALSMWNIIIARTYFQMNIPDELRESAFIEGASYTKYLLSIVLPLSNAIIAVLVLFYAVQHWNSYFSALIYLTDSMKYPLQLVLRGILVQSQTLAAMFDPDNAEFAAKMQRGADLIKYGTIIVASAPLLILYPFLQKYFVKGIMIGSLKG